VSIRSSTMSICILAWSTSQNFGTDSQKACRDQIRCRSSSVSASANRQRVVRQNRVGPVSLSMHHVVAVSPGIAGDILIAAAGIGIASHVQPVASLFSP
jgi:hypothetical protein